jgi:hypothetical protein
VWAHGAKVTRRAEQGEGCVTTLTTVPHNSAA